MILLIIKVNNIYTEQKNRLFQSLIIAIIVFSVCFITFEYFKQKETYYDTIDSRLSDAAYTAALLFGDKFHEQSPFPNTISKEENIKNSQLLSSITEESDVIYVYTIINKQDKTYFTSSSATKDEQLNGNYTPYMYHYKDATQRLKDSFMKHKSYYDETTDEWGTFRSILIPREMKNGDWYIVGADIEVSFIQKKLNRFLIENIIAFVVLIGILFPFIIIYNRIIKKEQKFELEKQKQLQEQSKLAQMGEMIGNISHQWRQPLSELNSEVMNLEIDFEKNKLDKKTLEDRILKIENLTEHMSMTISDFNNFFKKEKQKETFMLSEVIEQALEICKSTFKQNNIELRKDFFDDIQITSYKGELIQALIAIFQNAKDAMISNQIEIPTLHISIKKVNNKVLLTIADNGGGIKGENLNKIFEPYFTTKFKSAGIGIGLYMTKLIIEKNMKGKLSVANKNNGAEFTIVL